MLRKTCLTLALLMLCGCATITSHTLGKNPKNSFYAGTQLDYNMLHDCFWCWLDLPVSIVGDTLMLPYDTWHYYHTPAETTKSPKPSPPVK
ncbi:YceK/YidQ family lipoprotein [Erwinia sorbitola]|uniref:YceK/YidQ family lipoprotein n=1 Tax=Erwinia sorbitola TaxID=2681984 RepID=A0A6I6EQ63_9GAMM|nr:YceK/YidQ family lipoprotein [Erwinia sorbitola]MTD28740.1 YceK/YidQ family lipoprotein [Erwinia sorbitola]QGU86812.1 YceK/YidQ family lipoprotein [Erwinia sorbitola]